MSYSFLSQIAKQMLNYNFMYLCFLQELMAVHHWMILKMAKYLNFQMEMLPYFHVMMAILKRESHFCIA